MKKKYAMSPSADGTRLEKIIPRGYSDVLAVCFGETFHQL
jgi:hypothetical protein